MKQRILKVLRSHGQENSDGRKYAKLWEDEYMDVDLKFADYLTPSTGDQMCAEIDWASMYIRLNLMTDTITIYCDTRVWREQK